MRTGSSLLIVCKSKTCMNDSAHCPPFSEPPTILSGLSITWCRMLGIMPGCHLKEAPAFICWDGSSVRREEKVCLIAMKPTDVLFKGALFYAAVSLSVFGFQFISLSGCLSSIHSSSLCHCVFFLPFVEVCWPPGDLKPQVKLRGTHNSNFIFHCLPFTGLHPRDLMYHVIWICKCDTEQGWACWERFCQKHCKNYEGQFKLHCTQNQVFMRKKV